MKEDTKHTKNRALIIFGTISSLIGDEIASVAISIWVAMQTDNPMSFAFVYSIQKFSRIFFSLFSGSIIDAVNKKKILYLTDFVQCILNIAMLVVMVSALSFHLKVLVFCAISGVQGFCLSLFKPASRAILPEIIADEKLQQTNSILEVSKTIVSTLSVLFAGALVLLFGVFVCIIINAVSFFISGLSEVMITYEFQKNEKQNLKTSKFQNIIDGYKYVLNNHTLLLLAVVAATMNFIGTPIFSNILTYQYKEIFHSGLLTSHFNFEFLQNEQSFIAAISTVMLFAVGIASVVGGIFAGKERKIAMILLVISLASISFLLMLVYFVGMTSFAVLMRFEVLVGVIIVVSSLYGVSMGAFNVYITTLYQRIVDRKFMGRFFAFNTILMQITSPISMMLVSVFVSRTNNFNLVYCFAFVISVLLFVVVKSFGMAVIEN